MDTRGHLVRLRGIWFDDKSGGACVHVDYIYDSKLAPIYTPHDIKRSMGDDTVPDFNEGQPTIVVCRTKSTWLGSDNFHEDGDEHYDAELRGAVFF